MRGVLLCLSGFLLLFSLCWAPSSEAQPLPAGYSYSFTPLFHADTDLDEGGEARFGGLLMTLGQTSTLNPRTSLGWRLHYDYQDWSFNQPAAFGGNDPWDNFYRYGVSGTFAHVSNSGWVWNVTPTIGYAGESGADFSDAIEYGATVAMVRRYSDDLTLGFGLGIFRQIEDNFIFPLVVVNWRINEHWRLTNPSPSGPAGPAGLEFAYAMGGGWDTGFGATFRQERQRLDSDGPVAGGVGEHRYAVVFTRIGRDLSATARLNFYVGAELNTEIRVEDANGNELFSDEADAGLMLGLSLAGRF